MTIFSAHPVLRWAVPGVATAAVIGAGTLSGVINASADAGLPDRSAAQLLVDVQQARLDGLSGTVVQHADLGLPELPAFGGSSGSGGSGSSKLSSLVSGTHTMRLWHAGPGQSRLALLGTLGESDVIRNGQDVWVWSSHDRTATHYTVPVHSPDKAVNPAPGATGLPQSPQQAADLALKAITPSTKVSTSGTASVAGRAAYELVLEPKDDSSLVSQVRIAIDGTRHVPLRVQVFAKQAADPAFEVAFSSVDFGRPDAAQFRFTAPPGTTVKQGALGSVTDGRMGMNQPDPDVARQGSTLAPKVVGQGWGSVVVAKLPAKAAAATGKDDAAVNQMLRTLPTVSGSWGQGHLLAGTLFSVLLTDDGRVVAGAVKPDALYAALAGR